MEFFSYVCLYFGGMCVQCAWLTSNGITFKVPFSNFSIFEFDLIKISWFPQAVNAEEDIDTETEKITDLKLYVLSSSNLNIKSVEIVFLNQSLIFEK